MNKSQKKFLGNKEAARNAIVRCIMLYRRPAGRLDDAIAQIAKSAGIERARVRALYYDQVAPEMDDEDRHHTILGVCAARVWLAGWLRAVADEIEADTDLIQAAENQRHVRDWLSGECERQNKSSPECAA